MPSANSLRDLLRIRDTNRELLESFNSTYGTALGRKNGDGEPAILVFVPRKIDAKWLPTHEMVPSVLQGPENLKCATDVIQVEGYERTPTIPLVEGQNLMLRDELRGGSTRLRPGSQLAFWDQFGFGYYGTLGCFAREGRSRKLGFVTNSHVGEYVGNVVKHPDHTSRAIGIVRRELIEIDDEDRFDGIIDERDAHYRLDCSFVELFPDIDQVDDIDSQLRILDSTGMPQDLPLGPPIQLDIDSLGPVGKRVLGVGRTMGCQRGTIFAFGYEWLDESHENHYTDYLIANEVGGQFSAGGDSGKLIVTDDTEARPVALLWGGIPTLRARHDRQPEDWSFAVDINVILNRLDLSIVSSGKT